MTSGPGNELRESNRGRRGLRPRREAPPRLGYRLLGLVHENPGPARPVGGADLEAHGLLAGPEQAAPIPAPIGDGVMTGGDESSADRLSLAPRTLGSVAGDVCAATAPHAFGDTLALLHLGRSIANPS